MNSFNVRCCGQAPRWVENVPGKGYLYCGECRNEVLEPKAVDTISNLQETFNNINSLLCGDTRHQMIQGVVCCPSCNPLPKLTNFMGHAQQPQQHIHLFNAINIHGDVVCGYCSILQVAVP